MVQRAVEVVQTRGALGGPRGVVDGPHRVRRRGEVLRQERGLLDRDLGPSRLDGQADAPVQLLTVPREHRAVHDLAEPRLPEAMHSALGLDDPRGGQLLERTVHVDLLGEDRAERRGVEAATDDRGRVQDAPLRRGDRVDPTQQELLERIG